MTHYNIIGQSYYLGQEVKPDKNCNGWTAINKGDTLAWVNGVPLKPYPPGHPELSGESFGVSGNEQEVYDGRIKIVFDNSVGTNPWIVIVQKFYIKLGQ